MLPQKQTQSPALDRDNFLLIRADSPPGSVSAPLGQRSQQLGAQPSQLAPFRHARRTSMSPCGRRAALAEPLPGRPRRHRVCVRRSDGKRRKDANANNKSAPPGELEAFKSELNPRLLELAIRC